MMLRPLLALLAILVAAPLQAAGFTPLDRAAARQLVDAGHQRQATIVTLWSSECSHCKKNLQLLANLVKSNPKLRVVTVAAESESAELAPILERYALHGPRYAYGSDNPEAIAYALDPDWAGELPRTYLFNGAGHKEKISGVITQQMAEKATGLRF